MKNVSGVKLLGLAATVNSRRMSGRCPLPLNQRAYLERKTQPKSKGVSRSFFPSRAVFRAHHFAAETPRRMLASMEAQVSHMADALL